MGLSRHAGVDEQGRLYFSDVLNGDVYRRNPDGRIETVIPSAEASAV
jgi:sugar lactone lactonase YvrE